MKRTTKTMAMILELVLWLGLTAPLENDASTHTKHTGTVLCALMISEHKRTVPMCFVFC